MDPSASLADLVLRVECGLFVSETLQEAENRAELVARLTLEQEILGVQVGTYVEPYFVLHIGTSQVVRAVVTAKPVVARG